MISLLLADDHTVVRQGLRTLLEADPELSVIGEASDGYQALEQVEQLKPDVLVLDLMMPGMNGMEVTRQVCSRFPHTRVVILSMHADEAYVLEALRAGALAYVLKESQAAELLRAIHEAYNRQHYLSEPLSERAIEVYVLRTQDISQDPFDRLTPREREVLQLAAEGRSNAEIGEKLCLSGRTIEMHRSNLMHKLSRYALKRGIIE
jgi:two-component system response regulator NreC